MGEPKENVERARAEGVRWARRRFGEAIEDTLRTVTKSLLSDDDWILGVTPFKYPDNVHAKPYGNLQLSPLTDAEVDSIAADMKQAGNEDTDIPF